MDYILDKLKLVEQDAFLSHEMRTIAAKARDEIKALRLALQYARPPGIDAPRAADVDEAPKPPKRYIAVPVFHEDRIGTLAEATANAGRMAKVHNTRIIIGEIVAEVEIYHEVKSR